VSAINNIQVTENSDRLDRYLSQELSDLSRSRIQQLIEQGHVQINNLICTSKKINLKTGDLITLEIPTVQPLAIIAENIPLDILYEDDELIIINKPAGLVVHPAPGHPDGTLVNAI
jgi:23S rRNA pseudouridine1911/1915/1917 synthase